MVLVRKHDEVDPTKSRIEDMSPGTWCSRIPGQVNLFTLPKRIVKVVQNSKLD